MSRVADDPKLAEKLSFNASKIYQELSKTEIMNKWESLY